MKKLSANREGMAEALRMAAPSMVEYFFVALASLVDTFMVSTLGQNAVASVGLCNQPRLAGFSVAIALNVSISALVARRYGQKDRHSANGAALTALMITVSLSVIIGALFQFFASPIISFFGSNAETHDGAVTYIRIIMGGMIFNCVQMALNSALRGSGNTKITMVTNLTSNFVNIVMNYLLIGGNLGFPKLGIAGAAYATVFGSFVSCVLSVVSVCKKDSFINLPYMVLRRIRPKWLYVQQIIRLGYSVFFEQILLRVGISFTVIMVARLGTSSMAAHQVATNLMSISFSFGDGISAAAVALIGRSLGEKRPDRAQMYGMCCESIGLVAVVILTALYVTLGHPLLRAFFPDNPETVVISCTLLYFNMATILFQIPAVIFMGCLRGAGDTLYTAVATMVCVTFVRTSVAYLFAFPIGYGVYGIWVGVVSDVFLRLVLSSARFFRGKWKKIDI